MENNYTDEINCGYYPLRAIQRWLINTYFNKTKSTMMNINVCFKLPQKFDLNRLARCINESLNSYDVARCRLVIHPENNQIYQRFDGEIIPVVVEKMSDEEFEQRKKYLKVPFKILNQPLYRFYLFETPTAKYFYGDGYHAIIDGTSWQVLFWREIEMRYKGEKIIRKPLKYADFILEELKILQGDLSEGYNFFYEMLKDFDAKKHLPPADVENVSSLNQGSLTYNLKNIDEKLFIQRKHKENIFFLAASMLTIAKTAGSKSSVMSWLHNGRYNAKERRLIGIMIEQFPINWNFEKDITVAEFFDGIAEKIKISLNYHHNLGKIYEGGLQDKCATFIFQKKIYSLSIDGEEFEAVDLPQNEFAAVENSLDIEVNLNCNQNYYLLLDYDASRYSEAVMQKFATTFNEIVLQLQNENIFISNIL